MPEVTFNGSEGRLEGRYHHSEKSRAPLAIILHPHPRLGGNMNNKVVYTLFKCFTRLGFSVLRFNFRSVGRSQRVFEGGPGELSDAASALDWLQSMNPESSECWVAGYSFGAWIGMQLLMRRPEIEGFISVSPPAGTKDFSFLAPCPSSGLIVQGAKDEVVSEPAVANLARKLNAQKNIKVQYHQLPEADHYLGDQLLDLHQVVSSYVLRELKRVKKPLKRR
ncbi:MAG: alpha/beta hydrolase [Alphaproteobacteria bacterium]